MTALLYFVVAVVAAGLSTRVWLADRESPAHVAFFGLGWCVAAAYAAFALSLLPGLELLRTLYMVAGSFVPAFSLWCVDRMFQGARRTQWTRTLFLATVTVVPVAAALHLLFYRAVPRSSPPEVVTGLFTFGALALTVLRVAEAYEATHLQVERQRLRYLLTAVGGAAGFTVLEQLARNLAHPVDPAGLSLSSRGVVLQGAIPPFSVLFAAIALYFLYQSLVMFRLVDIFEMFSRLVTLTVSAALLVFVDGITVRWVDTFTDYPFHSTFQIFLASILFLAAYEPVSSQIAWWSNRLFNQRGQQLADTLASLHDELPRVISTRGLTDLLVSRLHASGRVPTCSVYLWDAGLDAFAWVADRGTGPVRPLAAVASRTFIDPLAGDEPFYLRATLARITRADDGDAGIVDLMDAMNADLTLPFVSRGGVVLGWLNLRAEDWSDGFTVEEIRRLQEITRLASVVLSNIQDFQALEEEHRLAALGAMAAGLAHEIRNPLAGIKGAAQFLQAESVPGDAQEMLRVIVHEADRLNVVVAQFLDYARPFELHLAPVDLNDLADHALALLRAQGVPTTIEVRQALATDLPALTVDRHRIEQVVINLLQNALQAMPRGGVLSLQTRQRVNRSGQPTAEIVVSDTGVGIPPEDFEKLFIPFYTTKRDGTGLGLPICQRIVQAHGGELDVQSVPGRGATFVVRLPIPDEEDRTARTAAK